MEVNRIFEVHGSLHCNHEQWEKSWKFIYQTVEPFFLLLHCLRMPKSKAVKQVTTGCIGASEEMLVITSRSQHTVTHCVM